MREYSDSSVRRYRQRGVISIAHQRLDRLAVGEVVDESPSSS